MGLDIGNDAVGAIAHFDGVSWTRSDPGSQETIRLSGYAILRKWRSRLKGHILVRGVTIQDGGAAPSDGGWTVYPMSSLPEQDPDAGAPLAAAWARSRRQRGLVRSRWKLERALASTPIASHGVRGQDRPTGGRVQGIGCTPAVQYSRGIGERAVGGRTGEERRFALRNAEGDTPASRHSTSQTLDSLNGVWAASGSEAWSVGGDGTIRQYTGDRCTLERCLDVPTSVNLNAVGLLVHRRLGRRRCWRRPSLRWQKLVAREDRRARLSTSEPHECLGNCTGACLDWWPGRDSFRLRKTMRASVSRRMWVGRARGCHRCRGVCGVRERRREYASARVRVA